ncbi:MAG: ArsC/Spx/MgsR family protein [Pseudomonadota bacterium]
MLTLYGLKSCDTCKKALAALKAAAVETRFIDIRAEADLAATVPAWLETVGAEALINKRSTTWRGLDDAAKAAAEGEGAAALLIANPTLIKRPVIEAPSGVTAGWTAAIAAALTAGG